MQVAADMVKSCHMDQAVVVAIWVAANQVSVLQAEEMVVAISKGRIIILVAGQHQGRTAELSLEGLLEAIQEVIIVAAGLRATGRKAVGLRAAGLRAAVAGHMAVAGLRVIGRRAAGHIVAVDLRVTGHRVAGHIVEAGPRAAVGPRVVAVGLMAVEAGLMAVAGHRVAGHIVAAGLRVVAEDLAVDHL